MGGPSALFHCPGPVDVGSPGLWNGGLWLAIGPVGPLNGGGCGPESYRGGGCPM